MANYTVVTRELSLSRDESKAAFVIIRHNVRTYQSAGVVEVVRGRENAETAVNNLAASQSSQDRQEGWRYFFEKTDLTPGMDPEEATNRRQAALELRESKAGDPDHSS